MEDRCERVVLAVSRSMIVYCAEDRGPRVFTVI
uniref:Uncharacterized protein n=1 Tax=Streptomyces sp. WAC2288 TaxID=1582798 RepID=A0A1I9J5N4_9ACTN|nr:hypothetical protein [Streptomyces sp. WAC2288]